MSQLRRDPIYERWVIVRTDDYLTPNDYEKEDNTPTQVTTSPFAYHREHMTPPEVDAIRGEDTQPNAPGWSVRVVPNKFPALRIEGELDKYEVGIYEASNGIGAHEVLVETPDPLKQMADFAPEEIHNVIRMYQRRCVSLSGDKRFKYIMVFKNYGESAGTSLDHAHSQIIALPMVPIFAQEELDGANDYFKYRGKSIYSDIIAQEYEDKERIVTQNDDFLVFCPYVSRYSFETWILPKNENSRFTKLEDSEQYNLACILKETLQRIKVCLDDPSFNYYLRISPTHYDHEEAFLWHIEIVPKLARITGFEWNAGFYVVDTPPEIAAKYLRGVQV